MTGKLHDNKQTDIGGEILYSDLKGDEIDLIKLTGLVGQADNHIACVDAVVGYALLRGVSGGERKRVTVGEVLVGGHSLILSAEISTGLDSAATFDIIKSMRTWCKTLLGTPEVVETFE
ncbi:hypothetical protein PHYPSEUDO_011730 [Phytophthora pseudosyringae]|uniref:Uncharacterized protein n=1 Tax=Phytophthora pseudosyringae TaxID=221518 RepID=A0A8T1V803_9STRA|nr:hypothetical protein PHYPSEUDO_011730 [Phytophthora pseudosyringae]